MQKEQDSDILSLQADRLQPVRKADVVPLVAEEVEKRIGRSLEDIKARKYIRVAPDDERQLDKVLGISP